MEDEHLLLSAEAFAKQHCYPLSLVRLIIECGCPTQNGLVDYPTLVMWFLDNWEEVRRNAGLPECLSIEFQYPLW